MSASLHISPLTSGAFSLTVGGLKSPWKGEYKEPRPPPPDEATCHQTLHTPPKESPPAKTSTDGASEPWPPLPPEPPEQSRAPALNLSKEESGTWEPLPLSSLDPAPAKGPSFSDRRATFPELELQQLEMGTALGCGWAWVCSRGNTCTHTQQLETGNWHLAVAVHGCAQAHRIFVVVPSLAFLPPHSWQASSCRLCRRNPGNLATSLPFKALFLFSPLQNCFSTACRSPSLWRNRNRFSLALASTASRCRKTVKR